MRGLHFHYRSLNDQEPQECKEEPKNQSRRGKKGGPYKPNYTFSNNLKHFGETHVNKHPPIPGGSTRKITKCRAREG